MQIYEILIILAVAWVSCGLICFVQVAAKTGMPYGWDEWLWCIAILLLTMALGPAAIPGTLSLLRDLRK